jgi:hypothetical protein
MNFNTVSWQSASSVKRLFVRYLNRENSPGEYYHCAFHNFPIKLSVLVPTSDAQRDGYFLRLLKQIENQNFSGFELIIIRGDPLQGRAINVGATLAKGKYLLTLDDDTSLPDSDTFSKLVQVLRGRPDIGIVGGNNVVPKNAKPFVRRVMQEIPRRSWEVVSEITDSDLAEHPCLMMRSDEFKLIGGENELIPRGLDPYLREQFRNIGMRVVIAPSVIYHHLPPDTLILLLKQFYRNGFQAAYVNRFYPQWFIETPEHHGPFLKHIAFSRRFGRYGLRMLRAMVTGKPLWFCCQLSYALGSLAFRATGQRYMIRNKSN